MLIVICTFCITIISTIYNIFGMNLGVEAAWRSSYPVFVTTVTATIAGSVCISGLVLWYCRRNRILCY